MPINVPDTDFSAPNLPVCAVDLGFSKTKVSTGVSVILDGKNIVPPKPMQFATAIQAMNNLLECDHQGLVLILEAPLSFAFTGDGNPCHRHIELRRSYKARSGPISPKGWFYQAGATLSLASLVFLKRLQIPENVVVHLIEGFYCNITKNECHPADPAVAEALAKQFCKRDRPPLIAPRSESCGGRIESLPGVPGLSDRVPPVLLRPELLLRTN